jgi:hypothetical protein
MPHQAGHRRHCLSWALALALGLGTASAAQATPELEDRTRVITTYSERPDGSVVENRGSTVVVGRHLLTVLHNLQPQATRGATRVSSYVGGYPVTPILADANLDIAVLPIPAALCAQWCTRQTSLPARDPNLNESIRWYRKPATGTAVAPGWHAARVLGRTWSLASEDGAQTTDDCASGLVLEVNRPFRPGISGGGVWGADNRLVGIAQGSFRTLDGRETGYFKPLRCIRASLAAAITGRPARDSLASLTQGSSIGASFRFRRSHVQATAHFHGEAQPVSR